MTTEAVSREETELLGGEMLAWSDKPDDSPVSHGGALAALAARSLPAGARVLLAGHHDSAMVDGLLGRHVELTCLVRSYPDGLALAGRATGAALRVMVGGLSRLPSEERFDAVIAGAGLNGVASVEDTPPDWDTTLARLADALHPGGTLLLRLDNPVGLHRMVEAIPWYADRADSAWAVSGPLDVSQPANLAQLRMRLAAAGLEPGACFAAYPQPARATALLATDELDQVPAPGSLDAALHRACTEGFAGNTVLRDPARLAVDALHAGLGSALAPAWVAIARKSPAQETSADQLPMALLESKPCSTREATLVEVISGPDGWHWHALDTRAEAAAPAGPNPEAVHRDLGRLAGPVPVGRLMRTVLLDACVRRDLTRLRGLLSGYVGWLAAHADGDDRLADEYALATPDNVVVAGTAFAVLDPSWQATEPVPVDVALARGLWRFAAELLTGGYAHPWSSTVDVAGLTVVLGGLAGRNLDRTVVASAVEAEATISAAMRGLDSDGRSALAAELRSVEPTAPPPGLDSHQQLREAWERQRQELARIQALLRWTEEILTSREFALKRAHLTIHLLSGSISYRVGRLVITPARLLKRYARKVRRRVRRAARRLRGGAETPQ